MDPRQSELCMLYRDENESSHHLFFKCSYSSWNVFMKWEAGMLDPIEFNPANGGPAQQVISQLLLASDGPRDCYMACLVRETW